MPTYNYTLESLLEPRIRGSSKNNLFSKQDASIHGNKKTCEAEKEEEKHAQPNRIFITPTLYTTPEPKPIPDTSSDSFSSSPYVVNRKRRNFPLPSDESLNRIDGFDFRQQKSSDEEDDPSRDNHQQTTDGASSYLREGGDDNFLGAGTVWDTSDSSGLVDVAFVHHDSASDTSSSEVVDFDMPAEKQSVASNQGIEFYDADEDFFSDGSVSNVSSSRVQNIRSELCALRLNLHEQIERRKSAEDALSQIYSSWQRIVSLLSQAGLTLPTPLHASSNMQFEKDSMEQLCQELIVTRFVTEEINKCVARAEAEVVAETIIASKDQEISRLRDRLQYYEAVNHEMSQRNQEVVEMARRERQRKKIQRRWIWGGIGLSILIGGSVIASSYLPHTSEAAVISTQDCSGAASSK